MQRSHQQIMRLAKWMPVALALLMILGIVCIAPWRFAQADTAIAASATDIRPLKADDDAPPFLLRTVDGEPFAFDPRTLDRPVVIISFRGCWCPFCNMHLSELRQVVPEIRALGKDVLFLSGDRPELLYGRLQRESQETIEGLDYCILSDADAQAAIALGTAFQASAQTIARRHEKAEDIEFSFMASHGMLAVPSLFAID